MAEKMNKRLITSRQEEILRCCHHEFGGLTQVEAAEKLGVSQSTISDTLKRIKKKLPQMFPILTKSEMKRYHLYVVEGQSVGDIAEHFGVTPRSVQSALQRAKDKGMFFSDAKGRILSYNEGMDAEVRQQF